MKTSPLLFFLLILITGGPSCQPKKENKSPELPAPKTDSIAPAAPGEVKSNPYAPVDKSPLDISYFPADYPLLKMTKAVSIPPKARLLYSRPHLQGRRLFPDVLKYDAPWRLGANEATELDLYSDAVIQDKKIKAGRYILYCIPRADEWTIVLNSNIDSWGLQQDSTKDVSRFVIPVKQVAVRLEFFTMIFEKTGTGADLLMSWDSTEARLPIRFE
jgi:hypothetical protein